MSLNLKDAPKSGAKLPPPKAGTQLARLVGITGLGVQKREFQGEEKSPTEQLNFTYELPNDKMTTDKGEELPRWIGQNRVSFFVAEKSTLAKILQALDPLNKCDGDLTKLIGTPCFLSIVHSQKPGKAVTAKIASVTALPDGITAPAQISKSFVFDFYKPDLDVYMELPAWVKEVIVSATDFTGSALAALLANPEAPETTVAVTQEEDRPY